MDTLLLRALIGGWAVASARDKGLVGGRGTLDGRR